MESVKKLSVATVCGRVKVAEGEKKSLMRVVGVCIGTKTGTSQYGDWTALEGSFKATNIETGEVVHSGICLLPDVALTQILVARNAANNNPVEFAVDIIVTGDTDPKPGSIGYSYSANWLIESGGDDPLKAIEARLLALPAPVALPAPTAPTAEAAKGKKGA